LGGTSVEEGGLTRNLSILRKTLGEKPDDHQYVVTIPGSGYRFVADIREVGADGGFAAPYPGRGSAVSKGPSMGPRSVWAGLTGLVLLGIAAYGLRPARATRPEITSLAVLPLDNLSGDPAQAYFADGMTEALITNLARIRALKVVSRTSDNAFPRNQEVTPGNREGAECGGSRTAGVLRV
jgi:hypothetical protein